MAKAGSKPKKRVNGYKMPDPLPNGLILQDVSKKKWKLGPSIGKGGFGEIYSADKDTTTRSSSNYPYVVKIEPHSNGPLFVEMHFYMRCAKSVDIQDFKSERKLTSLGMPEYIGSGSHDHNGQKYRFLVMKKFGTDIWKLFLENNRKFPTDTVFKLGIQTLDVLEYIHSKEYIHADVKGANILLGTGKEANHQVYLVDFGLCSHYDKKYKPNPKKAHNGTIEYLSRDAHLGVESRRGDLEILGYNLTQWLGCVLPWEKNLSNPIAVQKSKEEHMENLPKFFRACFSTKTPPAALVDYFKYFTSLSFDADPNYKKLRKILLSGLEAAGGSLKSPLQFKSETTTPRKRRSVSKTPTPMKKARNGRKKPTSEDDDAEDKLVTTPKTKSRRKPVPVKDENEDEDEDEELPISIPKKKAGRKPKAVNSTKPGTSSENNSEQVNYTAEMLRIKNKIAANKKTTKTRKQRNVKEQNNSLNSSNHNDSVTIISDSEDENDKVKIVKKRLLK